MEHYLVFSKIKKKKVQNNFRRLPRLFREVLLRVWVLTTQVGFFFSHMSLIISFFFFFRWTFSWACWLVVKEEVFCRPSTGITKAKQKTSLLLNFSQTLQIDFPGITKRVWSGDDNSLLVASSTLASTLESHSSGWELPRRNCSWKAIIVNEFSSLSLIISCLFSHILSFHP